MINFLSSFSGINALCGDCEKLELFARNTFKDWDCWGNEIKKEGEKTNDIL